MKKKKVKEEDTSKVFTLFLLFFPTIIIAVIPSEINGSFLLSLSLKLLLAFWQFIAFKSFVDSYYR